MSPLDDWKAKAEDKFSIAVRCRAVWCECCDCSLAETPAHEGLFMLGAFHMLDCVSEWLKAGDDKPSKENMFDSWAREFEAWDKRRGDRGGGP